MKRILATALLISATAIAAPAFAQNDEAAKGGALTGAATGAVGGAIVGGPIGAAVGGIAGAAVGATAGSLTPEDRVYIRDYAVRQRAAPVTVQERIVIGEPLPPTVKYYRVEGNPRVATYRYAYVNNHYYIVDESGRVVGEM
ncbi:DUF1236 domain-containing protein [Terrarubrum flagellatum]|uniref:DUF1236 domain-containing protein n=1 Tax=Terrirubrum flagellatum TaxID=2895980 RepID=UPI0031456535